MKYLIRWEIEVEADSYNEAAGLAWESVMEQEHQQTFYVIRMDEVWDRPVWHKVELQRREMR